MSLRFDPQMLPSPSLLNSMRDQRRSGPLRPTRAAEWYTPMLLFGQIGTVFDVSGGPALVGRIPIIETCAPVAWYVSSNVAATLTVNITYAPPPPGLPSADPVVTSDLQFLLVDTPTYTAASPTNAPALAATARALYEQTPSIAGWPASFARYGELAISLETNDLAEQILLVLYMLKVRAR